MSVSPSVQAIICEEIFDESSHPSVEEINEYAEKIGIDPEAEPHLLHLAKEGLMQALPSDWKPCFDEKSKSYYYYNSQTGTTQWEHPLDNIYRNLVIKVRSGSQASFEEDSKGHEDHTYTKEDLQSYEESLPKTLSFLKSPLSPVKKLEPVNLGAKKKELKLSPVKIKSKSMQDFVQKPVEFMFDRTGSGFTKKKINRNTFIDGDHSLEKSSEGKTFLPKNDKHPNTIEKGELTLSGGGSMFLKSQPKKLVTQISDSQLDFAGADLKPTDPEYLPKSILRDRSLPETNSFKEFFSRDSYDINKKQEPDDDRKSVRFNLETADREIEFDFSDSDQKSTSDEEIQVFAEPKIKPKPDLIKTSRFTVSPVKFDEYANQHYKKSESLFEKIENAEKLEEQASTRNSNLKLIKPNPTDFITPKLHAKPLDVVKPITLLSDSDDESAMKYKAKFPKDDPVITEKLSNVQDSIPEENSREHSVDLLIQQKQEEENKSVPVVQEQIKLTAIDEEEKTQRLKIEEEIKEKLAKYKIELELANEKEIDEFKLKLVESKKREMEKFRQELLEEQQREIEQIKQQEKLKQSEQIQSEIEQMKKEVEEKYKSCVEEEEEKFEMKLREKRAEMEVKYQKTLDEIEKSFKEKEKEIENNFQMSLKQTENDFLLKLEERIKEISVAHKAVLDRMKDDHELTLEELIRDFKSEEEILRKEQQQHLADIRDKIGEELESERARMRELGEDRLYEKVRCEKRLLEDKYRCLKEKYLRLKTDVKVSLERRNRRKEQSLTTTTGSDTERSTSHKKGSNSERININPIEINKKNLEHQSSIPKNMPKPHKSDVNSNRTKADNKNLQQIIIEDIDTSMSERSSRGNNDNDSRQKENDFDSSDGLSNPGRSRRKMFTRLKSSSTSRLNNNAAKARVEVKRSCSPVENLRRQLQKLEDLEDQFPQTAPSDTYHLRYPFSDAVSGDIAGSSELEFFRHRIHLERDSVRRAKESLRTQRSNFQKRQRELKLRNNTGGRNTLQQLYQEERELSDMEVSLHRTRSLLGEKVIRLRHLEQSLQRLSMSNTQDDATLSDLSSHSASSGISSIEFATAPDVNVPGHGKNVKFREEHLQESSEIMQSLENLNSEIREIWDVLNKQQHAANVTAVMPPVPLVYSEHVWPVPATNLTLPTLNAIPTLADRLHDYHQRAALASHGVQSIVVTQPPRASQGSAVTTTLVERTKNLRDWLRQTKAEQTELGNPGQATL